MLVNILIIVLLVCITGAISLYLYRQKKKGVTCIGCPHCNHCAGACKGHGASGQNKLATRT